MADDNLPAQARWQKPPTQELEMLALISEQLDYLAELQEFASPNEIRDARKRFAEQRAQIMRN